MPVNWNWRIQDVLGQVSSVIQNIEAYLEPRESQYGKRCSYERSRRLGILYRLQLASSCYKFIGLSLHAISYFDFAAAIGDCLCS